MIVTSFENGVSVALPRGQPSQSNIILCNVGAIAGLTKDYLSGSEAVMRDVENVFLQIFVLQDDLYEDYPSRGNAILRKNGHPVLPTKKEIVWISGQNKRTIGRPKIYW